MATYEKTALNGHISLSVKPRTLLVNQQIDEWMRQLDAVKPEIDEGIQADIYYSQRCCCIVLACVDNITVHDESIADMQMLGEFWRLQDDIKTIERKFHLWSEYITDPVSNALFNACIMPNEALLAPPELRVPKSELKKTTMNGTN